MDDQISGGVAEAGNEPIEASTVERAKDFNLDYTGDEGIIEDETKTQVEPTVDEVEQKGQNLPLDEEQAASQEPQPEQPEKTDVETLQARINELSAIVNKYQQQELAARAQHPSAGAQPTTTPQQPQPQAVAPQQQSAPQMMPGQISNLDFLEGVENHIDLLETKEGLNSLLNKVASVAYTAAVQSASERIMREIPSLVQSSAQQQQAIASITGEFYQKNPDLVNFKQAVSMAAMQIYNEKPTLSLPEMLTEAAKRTREMLHISGAAQAKRRRVPAQPAGGSIRSSGGNRPSGATPQLTPQEQQILDLITF